MYAFLCLTLQRLFYLSSILVINVCWNIQKTLFSISRHYYVLKYLHDSCISNIDYYSYLLPNINNNLFVFYFIVSRIKLSFLGSTNTANEKFLLTLLIFRSAKVNLQYCIISQCIIISISLDFKNIGNASTANFLTLAYLQTSKSKY